MPLQPSFQLLTLITLRYPMFLLTSPASSFIFIWHLAKKCNLSVSLCVFVVFFYSSGCWVFFFLSFVNNFITCWFCIKFRKICLTWCNFITINLADFFCCRNFVGLFVFCCCYCKVSQGETLKYNLLIVHFLLSIVPGKLNCSPLFWVFVFLLLL